jgi:pimeloyl-ACP methyl ester carboxylesterase
MLRPPIDYRDYAQDRKKLLMRILKRMEADCQATNKPILPYIQAFIRNYFHPVYNTNAKNNDTAVPHDEFCPKKGDVDRLFAWAFFGKHDHELEPWMKEDLDRMYDIIESDYNVSFQEGFTPEYEPMRLSLDPLEPHYRPFLIYGLFSLIKIMSGLLLRAAGFYACRTTGGLRYFYRPPKRESENNSGSNKLPLIFLHGIAPGGLAFYIPMLFKLGGDGRPLFLFENPDINFCLFGGNPLNEHDTVQGIWEAVDHHQSSVQDVSLVGHSFGSCPVTWLVHSSNSSRIRQIVLVDPVSICLSEPDVMHNFLYKRDGRLRVLSDEIFTQHYLRRHFAWYNSELFLEDLPKEAKVLVCLSERDQIVPVRKVMQQIRQRPEIDFLLWEDAGHAHCVTRPKTWRQMQILMRRQEPQTPDPNIINR